MIVQVQTHLHVSILIQFNLQCMVKTYKSAKAEGRFTEDDL